MSRALGGLIASLVARGKIVASAFTATQKRTVLQATALNGEVKDGLELVLPYGMSALPDAGDVLIFAVGGRRDHQVAIGADNMALRITDLGNGEFGFRDARGTQIVWRTNELEITTPLPVVGHAASWTLTGNLTVNGTILATGDITDLNGGHGTVNGIRTVYNSHDHANVQNGPGVTATPTPTMP